MLLSMFMHILSFKTIFIFALFDIITIDGARIKKGCFLDIKQDFTQHHPLVLNPTTKEFLVPDSAGIRLDTGGKILIACPGDDNSIAIEDDTQEMVIECVKNNIFLTTDEEQLPFRNFTCLDYPDSDARKTGNKCAGNYTEIEIGFDLSTGFIRTILTCLDESKSDTLYSIYNLVGTIDKLQVGRRPGGFQDAGFYRGLHPGPSVLYTKKMQLTAFAKLLKSDELAKKYIQMNNDFFLSRGHLTANSDFLYNSQQRATFYYVNVAPQWQSFNQKNWGILERNTRSFAVKRKLDLTIYTGVWGVATLPDINNQTTELYLYVGKNNKNRLTIPEVFWKVLHDPKSKNGIAFVGHNNPYEEDVAERPICTDICDQIDWLHWHGGNVTHGYSYCCEVDDLRKVVTYLPEIEVNGLLV